VHTCRMNQYRHVSGPANLGVGWTHSSTRPGTCTHAMRCRQLAIDGWLRRSYGFNNPEGPSGGDPPGITGKSNTNANNFARPLFATGVLLGFDGSGNH
jgi:hypothetical protein